MLTFRSPRRPSLISYELQQNLLVVGEYCYSIKQYLSSNFFFECSCLIYALIGLNSASQDFCILQSSSLYGLMTFLENKSKYKKLKSDARLHKIHERFGFPMILIKCSIYDGRSRCIWSWLKILHESNWKLNMKNIFLNFFL